MLVTVVVLAYNEEQAIGAALQSLRALGNSYEILVVDDGSSDRTGEIAQQFANRVVKHGRNRGYGAALKTGLRAARGDIVVFFDGDGQHDAEAVPRLVAALQDADLVVGERTNRRRVSPLRTPGKFLLEIFARIMLGRWPRDLNSGLRACRRTDLQEIAHLLPSGFSCSTTMTFAFEKTHRHLAYVPVETHKRSGSSTVRPVRDGIATLLLMLRLTVLFEPLRVFVPPALLCIAAGLGFAIHDVLYGEKGLADTTVLLLLTGLLLFFFALLTDQVTALRREMHEHPARRD